MRVVTQATRRSGGARNADMMRYAQSAQCRTRLLHEYFDEPYPRDCGHCDNCQAHAEGRAAAGLDRPLVADPTGHTPCDRLRS